MYFSNVRAAVAPIIEKTRTGVLRTVSMGLLVLTWVCPKRALPPAHAITFLRIDSKKNST